MIVASCASGAGNVGVITATLPTGTGIEYSLNGGAYQSSNVFNGLANGSYTVVARDNNGCVSVASLPATVSCGCANAPTLTLSSTSGSTCGTTPVTISGNSFGGSATSVSVTSSGAGTLSTTSFNTSPFNVTYTPVAADAGSTVVLTFTTDNPSGTPCVAATATYNLTVNPIPTVSVNSPTLCSGASAVLTATPAPSGTYTYAWITPTGVTNPGSVASFNATVAGTYSVTITNTVTNCTSGSQSAVVTVVNTPSIQLQNESICLGESITLVPIPSVQGGTYVWSPGGETTSSITVSPSKSSQYSVTYSVGQCTSKPASSTVSIDANPIAEFSANPNVFTKDSEIIQFVNNSKGAVTYKWDF